MIHLRKSSVPKVIEKLFIINNQVNTKNFELNKIRNFPKIEFLISYAVVTHIRMKVYCFIQQREPFYYIIP